MSYMLDARKIDEVISDPMIWSLKDKSSTTAPSALFHLASDKEGEPIWQFVSDLNKSFVNRIVARFLRHFACNIFGSLALVIWKRRVRTVNAQQLNLKQLLVLNSFVQRCITILLAVLPVCTGSWKFSLAHLIRIIRSCENEKIIPWAKNRRAGPSWLVRTTEKSCFESSNLSSQGSSSL